jgi:hypothetical protein
MYDTRHNLANKYGQASAYYVGSSSWWWLPWLPWPGSRTSQAVPALPRHQACKTFFAEGGLQGLTALGAFHLKAHCSVRKMRPPQLSPRRPSPCAVIAFPGCTAGESYLPLILCQISRGVRGAAPLAGQRSATNPRNWTNQSVGKSGAR